MKKYYSTQRPVSPGTFPKQGVLEIENFDYREYVEEIGRDAWGYLVYSRELTEEECRNYELVPADKKAGKLIVTDIQWDVDDEEVIEFMNKLTEDDFMAVLGFKAERLSETDSAEILNLLGLDHPAKLDEETRGDMVKAAIRHNRIDPVELLGIPTSIEIPDGDNPEWNEEMISEFISQETGYCHRGFTITRE